MSVSDRRLSEYDRLTEAIIGAGITVHKALRSGLPEQVYQRALAVQLTRDGLEYARESRVEVDYQGTPVGEFHLDSLVEDAVVVELMALEETSAAHVQ